MIYNVVAPDKSSVESFRLFSLKNPARTTGHTQMEGSFKVTDIGISYCAQIKHPIN